MIFGGAALTVSAPLSSIQGAAEEEGEEESDNKEQNEEDNEENGEDDEREEDEEEDDDDEGLRVDRQIEIEDRHHLLPCPDQFFPIPPDWVFLSGHATTRYRPHTQPSSCLGRLPQD